MSYTAHKHHQCFGKPCLQQNVRSNFTPFRQIFHASLKWIKNIWWGNNAETTGEQASLTPRWANSNWGRRVRWWLMRWCCSSDNTDVCSVVLHVEPEPPHWHESRRPTDHCLIHLSSCCILLSLSFSRFILSFLLKFMFGENFQIFWICFAVDLISDLCILPV